MNLEEEDDNDDEASLALEQMSHKRHTIGQLVSLSVSSFDFAI